MNGPVYVCVTTCECLFLWVTASFKDGREVSCQLEEIWQIQRRETNGRVHYIIIHHDFWPLLILGRLNHLWDLCCTVRASEHQTLWYHHFSNTVLVYPQCLSSTRSSIRVIANKECHGGMVNSQFSDSFGHVLTGVSVYLWSSPPFPGSSPPLPPLPALSDPSRPGCSSCFL